MVAQAQPKDVKITFAVGAQERDAASAVASKLGMNVEDAMKIMLRRFVAEKGLPFPMREPANDRGAQVTVPAHGISLGRLTAIAASAGKDAAREHAAAGRRDTLPDPDLKPVGVEARTMSR